jgi:uncharacterized protein (DUF1697 family)
MNTVIVILRGINVGGRNKIPMADLRMLFEKLGCTGVRTYIQSGNVIFNNIKEERHEVLSDRLGKAISGRFGCNVPVVIRTAQELKTAININPFNQGKNTDIDRLHVTFLKDLPSEEYVRKLETFQAGPDRFSIRGKDVFIFCHGFYHKTKLSNTFFEKMLKVPATTRSWKTVLTLSSLCSI